jgi:hypothetical protein
VIPIQIVGERMPEEKFGCDVIHQQIPQLQLLRRRHRIDIGPPLRMRFVIIRCEEQKKKSK